MYCVVKRHEQPAGYGAIYIKVLLLLLLFIIIIIIIIISLCKTYELLIAISAINYVTAYSLTKNAVQ